MASSRRTMFTSLKFVLNFGTQTRRFANLLLWENILWRFGDSEFNKYDEKIIMFDNKVYIKKYTNKRLKSDEPS